MTRYYIKSRKNGRVEYVDKQTWESLKTNRAYTPNFEFHEEPPLPDYTNVSGEEMEQRIKDISEQETPSPDPDPEPKKKNSKK